MTRPVFLLLQLLLLLLFLGTGGWGSVLKQSVSDAHTGLIELVVYARSEDLGEFTTLFYVGPSETPVVTRVQFDAPSVASAHNATVAIPSLFVRAQDVLITPHVSGETAAVDADLGKPLRALRVTHRGQVHRLRAQVLPDPARYFGPGWTIYSGWPAALVLAPGSSLYYEWPCMGYAFRRDHQTAMSDRLYLGECAQVESKARSLRVTQVIDLPVSGISIAGGTYHIKLRPDQSGSSLPYDLYAHWRATGSLPPLAGSEALSLNRTSYAMEAAGGHTLALGRDFMTERVAFLSYNDLTQQYRLYMAAASVPTAVRIVVSVAIIVLLALSVLWIDSDQYSIMQRVVARIGKGKRPVQLAYGPVRTLVLNIAALGLGVPVLVLLAVYDPIGTPGAIAALLVASAFHWLTCAILLVMLLPVTRARRLPAKALAPATILLPLALAQASTIATGIIAGLLFSLDSFLVSAVLVVFALFTIFSLTYLLTTSVVLSLGDVGRVRTQRAFCTGHAIWIVYLVLAGLSVGVLVYLLSEVFIWHVLDDLVAYYGSTIVRAFLLLVDAAVVGLGVFRAQTESAPVLTTVGKRS